MVILLSGGAARLQGFTFTYHNARARPGTQETTWQDRPLAIHRERGQGGGRGAGPDYQLLESPLDNGEDRFAAALAPLPGGWADGDGMTSWAAVCAFAATGDS